MDQTAGDGTGRTEEQLRVVGLPGSLREGSYTRMAVQVALQGAAEVGAQTELIDLRDYELSFCFGKGTSDTVPPDVARLRAQIKTAQGIILGTPEYHGSYSGLLKNVLDLMGFEEFEGKMIGLVGVSGGVMGAFPALTHLQAVGRALHAWVVPEQCSIPQAWQVFQADGTVRDAKLHDRLINVGRQVARFAYLHSSAATLEFVRQWEDAPRNPGGGEVVRQDTAAGG